MRSVLLICVSVLLSMGGCFVLIESREIPTLLMGPPGIQGEVGPMGVQGVPGANFTLGNTWVCIYDKHWSYELSMGRVEFVFAVIEDVAAVQWHYYTGDGAPGSFVINISDQEMEYQAEAYGAVGSGIMYIFGPGEYSGSVRTGQDMTGMHVQIYELQSRR